MTLVGNWNKNQAWERRKQLEALVGETPGGRDLGRLSDALRLDNPAGPIRDKDSVLRIASVVLESLPVEVDGVFRVGIIEITFDDDSNLSSLSMSEGGVRIAGDSTGTE